MGVRNRNLINHASRTRASHAYAHHHAAQIRDQLDITSLHTVSTVQLSPFFPGSAQFSGKIVILSPGLSKTSESSSPVADLLSVNWRVIRI